MNDLNANMEPVVESLRRLVSHDNLLVGFMAENLLKDAIKLERELKRFTTAVEEMESHDND